MRADRIVLGDWGTTRLRLYLMDGGRVAGRRDGPGIGALEGAAATAFGALAQDWLEAAPAAVLLCGMAGARNGWRETPYQACPADLDRLGAALAWAPAAGVPAAVVPGLACTNALGAPDVMRGEETQALGAMRLEPGLARGRHLLVLPGTHTKWVLLVDGRVQTFLTSLVGEMFALLRDRSSLSLATAGPPRRGEPGFAAGLERISARGGAHLPQLLFEARSRQLRAGLSAGEAAGFASGLLIGADVEAALRCVGGFESVALVGEPRLNALYAQALAAHGAPCRNLDGEAAVIAGLTAVLQASRADVAP